MSQENVEIVRAIYTAINRDDWDAAFGLTDPEVQASFQRGPAAGTHRGRDSIQAILMDQRDAFEAWIIEIEQLVDHGDRVVAVIRSRVRPPGTDAELEFRNGQIWTLRDGRVVSVRSFASPDEALEAAGLRG